MKKVKQITRSLLFLTATFVLLLLLSPTTKPLKSQISLCEIKEVIDRPANVVYCLGFGSTTCIVPSPCDGGGGSPPVLSGQ
jgi:Na+/phosphate symporter